MWCSNITHVRSQSIFTIQIHVHSWDCLKREPLRGLVAYLTVLEVFTSSRAVMLCKWCVWRPVFPPASAMASLKRLKGLTPFQVEAESTRWPTDIDKDLSHVSRLDSFEWNIESINFTYFLPGKWLAYEWHWSVLSDFFFSFFWQWKSQSLKADKNVDFEQTM